MKTLKIVVIVSIIAIIATLGVQYYLGHKINGKSLTSKLLDVNKALSSPSKDITIILNNEEMTLKPPRVKTTLIITSTEVTADIKPIQVCFLPMIGVETGDTIQPRVGVQFFRSEPLGLGMSCGLSPTTLDLSLDKDLRDFNQILSNTILGLGLGLDKAGYTRFLIHLSVFI